MSLDKRLSTYSFVSTGAPVDELERLCDGLQ